MPQACQSLRTSWNVDTCAIHPGNQDHPVPTCQRSHYYQHWCCKGHPVVQGTVAHANHFGAADWDGACIYVSTYISVLHIHLELIGYDKLVVSRAV